MSVDYSSIYMRELANRAVIQSIAAEDTLLRKNAVTGGREYEAAALGTGLKWDGTPKELMVDLAALAVNHNTDLTGLQGGGATERYHLNAAPYAYANAMDQDVDTTASPTFVDVLVAANGEYRSAVSNSYVALVGGVSLSDGAYVTVQSDSAGGDVHIVHDSGAGGQLLVRRISGVSTTDEFEIGTTGRARFYNYVRATRFSVGRIAAHTLDLYGSGLIDGQLKSTNDTVRFSLDAPSVAGKYAQIAFWKAGVLQNYFMGGAQSDNTVYLTNSSLSAIMAWTQTRDVNAYGGFDIQSATSGKEFLVRYTGAGNVVRVTVNSTPANSRVRFNEVGGWARFYGSVGIGLDANTSYDLKTNSDVWFGGAANRDGWLHMYDDDGGTVIATAAWTDVTWDTERRKDTTWYTHSADSAEVTIEVAGDYKVTYDVTADNLDTSGASSARHFALWKLQVNSGAGYGDIAGTIRGTYHRTSAAGEGSASCTIIYTFAADDKVKLVGRSDHATDVVTVAQGCAMTIEKIDV